MTAFTRAAFATDSPLTLRSLLRDIADSADWTRAEDLRLDTGTLRERRRSCGSGPADCAPVCGS